MMKPLENLVRELTPLIGGIVRNCTLLIWPDEDGYKSSDMRINFNLGFSNGIVRNVTFGTDSDGQTPLVCHEEISPQYNLADISIREQKWKEKSFWYSKKVISYETFNVAGYPEYSQIIGYRIVQVCILYFDDQEKAPTGLIVHFHSGKEICSIPGIAGNTILTELPQNWFPSPITKLELKENPKEK